MRRFVGPGLAGLVVACAEPALDGVDSGPGDAADGVLAEAIARDGVARAVVLLDDSAVTQELAGLRAAPEVRVALRSARLAALTGAFVRDLPPEVAVVSTFEHLPLVVVDLDDAAQVGRLASRTARNSLPAYHCGQTVSLASRSPTACSSPRSSTMPDRSVSAASSSCGLW